MKIDKPALAIGIFTIIAAISTFVTVWLSDVVPSWMIAWQSFNLGTGVVMFIHRLRELRRIRLKTVLDDLADEMVRKYGSDK